MRRFFRECFHNISEWITRRFEIKDSTDHDESRALAALLQRAITVELASTCRCMQRRSGFIVWMISVSAELCHWRQFLCHWEQTQKKTHADKSECCESLAFCRSSSILIKVFVNRTIKAHMVPPAAWPESRSSHSKNETFEPHNETRVAECVV